MLQTKRNLVLKYIPYLMIIIVGLPAAYLYDNVLRSPWGRTGSLLIVFFVVIVVPLTSKFIVGKLYRSR